MPLMYSIITLYYLYYITMLQLINQPIGACCTLDRTYLLYYNIKTRHLKLIHLH